ncbi:chlorophyllase/cutinase-like alpha/beta fold protein [Actinoplanes utahensis]|uniref:Alpha/beta hydrolase n=1 Tax=Actinoplanes utahensis TaxID=1869 RepID=A0A0A6WWT7_ACTUT|nr:alpha/beta hydrolase [Actinoplanes utahensis]KHD72162.1 hypothetical protein MB27_41705 [Actinoplanes utahensis]GIF27589.1 hypothetical protein Aut01nite_05750 [Actinoplanes utahensis]
MNVTSFRHRKRSATVISVTALVTALVTPPTAAPAAPAAAGHGFADHGVAGYATTINGDSADVYHPRYGNRLKVALVLQGANVDKSWYSTYARKLAAYGFVVVVPNHSRTIFGRSGLFPEGAQARWTVDWAAAEDADATSPLHQRISEDELVIAGHSFGAAAALSLSTGRCAIPFCTVPEAAPSELEAIVTYGGNNVPTGGTVALPVANTVPVGYIQGLADGVATPAEGESTYRVTTGRPKALIEVAGANHYGITDVQNPAGAAPDTSPQTLRQAVGVETVARWSAQWLLAQTGDRAARWYVYGVGDAIDRTVTVTYVR